MKILSLHIENFGKLSCYDHVFTDGLNVLKHENSWGKTTLATFLKAMFFGMEKKGNLKAYSAERSKYAPWQGGTYGGSVIFEVNGKTYRVLRTFAPTPEGDRFELIDLETNKQSKDFSSNLGEEIFGVGRETFTLSTFFPQGELGGKINDEIRSYLSGANDISGDVEMQSKAVKKLKNLDRDCRLVCPKNYEIISLEESIDDDKRELEYLENTREEIKNEIYELSQDIQNFKCAGDETGDMVGINNQISQIDKDIQEIQNNTEQFKQKTKKKNIFIFSGCSAGAISVILGILLAALGISLIAGIIFAAAGVIVIALTIVLLTTHKNHSKKLLDSAYQQKETLLIKKRQLDEQYSMLVASSSMMLENANEKKRIEVKLAVAQTKLEHVENDIVKVLEQLDEKETNLVSKMTIKEETEEKQKIINSAVQCLVKAQENISKRYVQPMQQQFNSIIKKLSDSKHITLDSDLNIVLDTQSGLKEKEYLSAGNQDMVEICKRFALVKSIFKAELPFIILDDPFVNLDENLIENMLKLIKDFAQEMQIIYLVCHGSRAGE